LAGIACRAAIQHQPETSCGSSTAPFRCSLPPIPRPVWKLFPGRVAYVWHAALKALAVAGDLEAVDFAIRSQIIWVKQRFALSRCDYR
jgi:hypothetical protein